jgi:hypothetical protein
MGKRQKSEIITNYSKNDSCFSINKPSERGLAVLRAECDPVIAVLATIPEQLTLRGVFLFYCFFYVLISYTKTIRGKRLAVRYQ